LVGLRRAFSGTFRYDGEGVGVFLRFSDVTFLTGGNQEISLWRLKMFLSLAALR
jgi:hypothetical protein